VKIANQIVFLGLSFFAGSTLLPGCVTEPAPTTPVVVEKPAEKVAEKEISTALKRQVKDIDLKKSEDAALKKRIVVLPFLDMKDRPEVARIKARNAFIDELNKSGIVIALEGNQLRNDASKYIKNGEYDLAKLSKDSQTDGMSALLEGKLIDLRLKQANDLEKKSSQATFEAIIRMRAVNIRSGKEIFNTLKTVTIEDENSKLTEKVSNDAFFASNPDLAAVLLKDAFLDFSSQVIEAMSQVMWEGRIAALKEEKIYLNVGRVSGVQVGDILKVVEDSNEVYDPEIGYHIGKIPGKAKGTLEIVDFFGQDGAISVIHSGAGFKENDRVELYQ
jgi:hypothetical protein